MKRWRLVAVAALTAGTLLAARPATAGDVVASADDVASDSSSNDVWTDVGWGALTGLSNLLYVPAKLVYAGLGGLTGGLALGLTGGDVNAAEAIWEPSVYGDYFLTPSMVQGEEPISFAGASSELTNPEPPEQAPPPPAIRRRRDG